MSEMTVRRQIAALRAQADALETKCNDPAHAFTEESHRARLQHEVTRLRTEARHEEEQLDKRAAARKDPAP